jgi:hypothetical protein
MVNSQRLRVSGQSFALLPMFAVAPAFARTPDRYPALTHPAVKWMSRADLPGTLDQYNPYEDGA